MAGIASERIGRESRSGALFVLRETREAIKVLFFDGSGLCLFYKRLDNGTFRVPEIEGDASKVIRSTERTLDDLLDGIDVEAKPVMRRPP